MPTADTHQLTPLTKAALDVRHQHVARCDAAHDTGSWVAYDTRTTTPKGVCHFLGGAFAGAAPQVLYNLLLQLVAEAGYTLIATPYAVTFNHSTSAKTVRQAFLQSLLELRQTGQGLLVPETVPQYGIGHSNGALLHLLIGSIFLAPVKSNVIISFNNKQVKDAIPVPGVLESLAPGLQAARNSSLNALLPPGLLLPTPEQLLAGTAAALSPFLPQQQLVTRATPALRQFESVFGELGEGVTEFTPTPAESRELISRGYTVPSNLLIQFADDGIDETRQLAPLLRAKYSQTQQIVLPGTHVTPCGSDVQWSAGDQFSVVDAFVQGAKSVGQADVRRLAGRIVDWLETR